MVTPAGATQPARTRPVLGQVERTRTLARSGSDNGSQIPARCSAPRGTHKGHSPCLGGGKPRPAPTGRALHLARRLFGARSERTGTVRVGVGKIGAHRRAEERVATSVETRRPLPRSFSQGRTSLDRAQASPRLLANRSVATAEQETRNRIAPSDGLGDRQYPLWIAQRQRGAPASDRAARPLACRRE